MTVADQAEHVQFTSREVFLTQMLSEPDGHFGRNMLSAGVDGTNCGEDFILWHALQQVRRRPSAQGALGLAIAVLGAQRDDAGRGELASSGVERGLPLGPNE